MRCATPPCDDTSTAKFSDRLASRTPGGCDRGRVNGSPHGKRHDQPTPRLPCPLCITIPREDTPPQRSAGVRTHEWSLEEIVALAVRALGAAVRAQRTAQRRCAENPTR